MTNELQMVRIDLVVMWRQDQMTLAKLLEMIAEIRPPPDPASVILEYQKGSYGDGDEFNIYYKRPETDEERAKRVCTVNATAGPDKPIAENGKSV